MQQMRLTVLHQQPLRLKRMLIRLPVTQMRRPLQQIAQLQMQIKLRPTPIQPQTMRMQRRQMLIVKLPWRMMLLRLQTAQLRQLHKPKRMPIRLLVMQIQQQIQQIMLLQMLILLLQTQTVRPTRQLSLRKMPMRRQRQLTSLRPMPTMQHR